MPKFTFSSKGFSLHRHLPVIFIYLRIRRVKSFDLEYLNELVKAKKEQIDERRGRRHPSPAARPDDHA